MEILYVVSQIWNIFLCVLIILCMHTFLQLSTLLDVDSIMTVGSTVPCPLCIYIYLTFPSQGCRWMVSLSPNILSDTYCTSLFFKTLSLIELYTITDILPMLIHDKETLAFSMEWLCKQKHISPVVCQETQFSINSSFSSRRINAEYYLLMTAALLALFIPCVFYMWCKVGVSELHWHWLQEYCTLYPGLLISLLTRTLFSAGCTHFWVGWVSLAADLTPHKRQS